MFSFRRRKKDPQDELEELKFIEVTVAPNEAWTVWNKPRMPLVFPTHTFSRFVRVALGEEIYTKYARANLEIRLQNARAESYNTVMETWHALDKELTAWRDYTMDRYASLPTFCYFGDDAIKAMRAVVSANFRRTTLEKGWQEVPVSFRSKGTIIYRAPLGRMEDALYPEVCVPHGEVKCVIGTAWDAHAYLGDSVLDIRKREYVKLSHEEVQDIIQRSPTPEYTFMLIRSFLENFGADRSADWQILTRDFIPAQFRFIGTDVPEDIPSLDQNTEDDQFVDQLWNLILWSYHAGILCRVYQWIDAKLGARRHTSP